MFERYLERARRVLFFARYEASQLGSMSIEPPHLLLAILREGSAVMAAVLERSNLSAESARDEIVRLSGPTTASVSSRVEIPFSANTKRALGYAAEEADRLNAGSDAAPGIDSDHLLLAVLRLEGPLTSLFSNRGVTIATVRALIAKQRYDPPPSSSRAVDRPIPAVHGVAPLGPGTVFEVRIAPTRLGPDERGATLGSNDHWTLEGTDLVSALSDTCGERQPGPIATDDGFPLPFPMSRIELDPSFDRRARYDLQVRGHNLSRDLQKDLLRLGIEQYFSASVVREERLMDVLVLTAPNARLEELRQSADFAGGGFGMVGSFSVAEEFGPDDTESMAKGDVLRHLANHAGAGRIGSVSADGASMNVFCHMLEMPLGRPVVNETGLTGTYSIQLPEMANAGSFSERLERELGLTLTEARRNVPFIVLRKN